MLLGPSFFVLQNGKNVTKKLLLATMAVQELDVQIARTRKR
jgi:hypothetical protein